MSLYTRLAEPAEGEEKIPIHQFQASIAEGARGFATRQQVIDAYNIAPADEAALDFIYNKATGWTTDKSRYEFRQVLHDVLLLAEARIAYLDQTTFVARLNAFVGT
ncbi:MAG TPA: hypothetical protein VMZ92_02810 [Planctomycetota bacterium]|nr:hypothetical protein [Planctomycetota bacterium]